MNKLEASPCYDCRATGYRPGGIGSGNGVCYRCGGTGYTWKSMAKVEGSFGVTWVSVGGELTQYTSDRAGGYALRADVEELQLKAARLYRTIDLMRRAEDIETVRAIAAVCIGQSPDH